MPVDTIVACVDLAPHEPLEAWGVTRIQSGMPVLVPGQHVGILFETVRKVLQAEPVIHSIIGQIRLGNEFCGRIEELFFPPMHCDFSFGCFDAFPLFFLAHCLFLR